MSTFACKRGMRFGIQGCRENERPVTTCNFLAYDMAEYMLKSFGFKMIVGEFHRFSSAKWFPASKPLNASGLQISLLSSFEYSAWEDEQLHYQLGLCSNIL